LFKLANNSLHGVDTIFVKEYCRTVPSGLSLKFIGLASGEAKHSREVNFVLVPLLPVTAEGGLPPAGRRQPDVHRERWYFPMRRRIDDRRWRHRIRKRGGGRSGSILGATVWENAVSGSIIKIHKIQRNNR